MTLVWIGSVLAVAAIALLRLAWGRPKRSAPLNAASWGLLAVALVLGAAGSGAWGTAVVSLAAMACAFVILTHAALTSRRSPAKPSERRARLLEDAGPLGLGRRLVTFLLTVPLALAASLAIGLAGRSLAGFAGWHEANGNVLTLFLMPVAWSILAFLLLMAVRRRTQALLLLAPALASLGIVSLGMLL